MLPGELLYLRKLKVMKKFFNIVIKALLWVWQFPQHMCALVYLNKPFDKVDNPVMHYERHGWSYEGAVTLGEYIFTNKNVSVKTLMHEYGHVIQSRMLGPLYLLVIGLQSIVHAMLHDDIKPYSHFWTESWADRLGEKYIVKKKLYGNKD